MKNTIAFALCLFVMAFSCEKEDLNQEELSTKNELNPATVDYFIFGQFHCFCNPEAGTCASLYKYVPGSLIKGRGTGCNFENFIYQGTSMPAEDVAVAADLLAKVPKELYESKESTFGCPDCADQGGYLVSISQNGKVKTWRIDTWPTDLPAFLLPFHEEIMRVMQELEQ